MITFEISPRFASSVYVHEYNISFRVQVFNSFLGQHHREALASALSLIAWSPGFRLWLRKN